MIKFSLKRLRDTILFTILHEDNAETRVGRKLAQLSPRSHARHLLGKRTAQKDIIRDTTSDSRMNSNVPYRWLPASLTYNNSYYFYLFLYLYKNCKYKHYITVAATPFKLDSVCPVRAIFQPEYHVAMFPDHPRCTQR